MLLLLLSLLIVWITYKNFKKGKNVLKQNQREIETMDKQIVKEIKDGIIQDPTVQVNNNNDEVI